MFKFLFKLEFLGFVEVPVGVFFTFLLSSAPTSASVWAKLVLFPENPGRRPTIRNSANRAWTLKEKLQVYMNKPQKIAR